MRKIYLINPKFSIVTVTWNNLAGLRATLTSVAAQTYRDFEWIIADGASTDGTVEAATSAEFLDAHFLSAPDEGLYDAMNKGLNQATGDYVIFMNGGDTFADEHVLAEVAALRQFGSADLIYGDAWEIDGEHSVFKPAFSHHTIPYTMFAHHQSIFYRRKAVRDLRYDLSYKIGADWVFTALILKHSKSVCRLRRAICRFERGGLSQSSNPKVLRQLHVERERALREIFNVPVPVARLLLGIKEAVESVRRRFPRFYDRLRMRRM